MTTEIRKMLKHLLQVSTKMISRELPKVSAAINAIGNWLNGIDYQEAVKMNDRERATYDLTKIKEIKERIGGIEGGE